MKLYIPLLATTVAFVAACNDPTPSAATTETTSAAQQIGGGTTVTLSKEDRQFMTDAALGGMYEVMLGQEVQRKATSPDVREFAATMVRDHGRANDELKQLAARKGFEIPRQLDEEHRQDITDIMNLSGPELDKEYIGKMVDDHEMDVQKFRDASQEAKDPDIRGWAGRTLRTLEGHLAMAKQLKERLGE